MGSKKEIAIFQYDKDSLPAENDVGRKDMLSLN